MDRHSRIELLLDRYENPKYKHPLDNPSISLEGGNPGCADLVTIHLCIHDEKIAQIGFEGEGCTISQASADFLAELVEGKSVEEIDQLDHEDMIELLGEEVVKNRTKCALLPLDTLKIALKQYREEQIRAELDE